MDLLIPEIKIYLLITYFKRNFNHYSLNFNFFRLANALVKIDQFNEEESSFGWELSQYPKRKAVYDRLVPFKKLYDAGYDFLEKHKTWMTSKVIFSILDIP